MSTLNRSALRRNTASKLLDKIKESTQRTTRNREQDPRYWQPTVDGNGNGYAVIRFLPARTEDSLPYVKQYNHGFKVGNRWFINNCPTTIGLPSPVVEMCNELWESGLESDKKIARERKRRLRYYSNVLIVKDPKNPENEGQVKIYTYGQKVFEKLLGVMNPPEEFGEEPRDPFSFFDGCVMKLKLKNVAGYRNYDDSTVESDGDLFDGDEDKLEEILTQLHDIDEINDPKNFKDYDTLKRELYRVLGENVASDDSPVQARNEEKRDPSRSTEYGASIRDKSEDKEQEAEQSDDSELDDDLAMFQALADDD